LIFFPLLLRFADNRAGGSRKTLIKAGGAGLNSLSGFARERGKDLILNNAGNFFFTVPEWLAEVGSTNDCLRERFFAGTARPGLVLAAKRQTRGRGRQGNRWLASPDGDLAFSFLWLGETSLREIGTLPMACALGLCDFAASVGVETRCRWPNDVMAGDGKLAGILAEAMPASDRVALALGVGLNLIRDAGRDHDLEKPSASLEALAGFRLGREEALVRLLPFIAARIGRWGPGGFAAIRSDLAARMWGVGKTVSVRTGDGVVRGRISGLGDGGELLLELEAGGVRAVSSAAARDWPDG
jgi:BirA family biotin operon repressor/biotin-[acetyl-CoA-carboxylase] ligase